MKNTKVFVATISLLFGSSLLMAACGQKGPLYLPKTKQETNESQQAPQQNQDPKEKRGSGY